MAPTTGCATLLGTNHPRPLCTLWALRKVPAMVRVLATAALHNDVTGPAALAAQPRDVAPHVMRHVCAW